MEVRARRAATLKRLTRASALAAAALGLLVYAGISGLPNDVLGWLAPDSQPQVTTGDGAPDAGSTTAQGAPEQAPDPSIGRPQQAPGAYTGAPVRARSGGS